MLIAFVYYYSESHHTFHLLQMSASMQIWHSCCHFVYQQMQTCACSERRLIDSRRVLFVRCGTGSDQSLRRHGCVRVLFRQLSCCKCTSLFVSAHLLSPKKGLMGVHATNLLSKDTGQGDGCLFAAKKEKNPFPSSPCLSVWALPLPN